MMKSPRAAVRRPGESHDAGSIEVGPDRVVIRLPDPRLITLVARSVFLVTAIVSFPWLRAMVLDADLDVSTSAMARNQIGHAEESVFLPMLFRDLNRQGLLRAGDKAVFVGDPGARLSMFLKKNQIDVVGERRISAVAHRTVSFIFVGNGFGEAGFRLIDRALKVTGIVAFRLVADPAHSFKMPSNYMIAYIRRFGSTIVALKKIANVDPVHNAVNSAKSETGRRLLSFPGPKKEALEVLEDVLLEPPSSWRMNPGKYWKKTKFLPDLTGDSLDGYPRRVFVDIGISGRAESTGWFKKRYPAKNCEFEMIRVDVAVEGKGAMAAGEWLERNVKEEEYVVMKAEAEAVEEMLKGESVRLVDELFLECQNNQWRSKGTRKSRRAYWECLALYGKLRDQGVAVQRWWG